MFFQKNIIKKYLSMLPSELTEAAWIQYSKYFLNAEIQQNIRQSKEEQFQEGFLRELFVKVLGYTLNPSPGYNLITEQKNETNSKKADGAILLNDKVVGVIELKDHKTTDLSKVEAQAFGYMSQHEGTRIVVISNFEKLRLYIDNAVEHREWNLFTLTEQDFRELYLCLAWTQIEKGIALQMKAESVSNEDQITNALYKDYSQFKRVLFTDILKNNPYDGTQVSHLRGAAGETPAYQNEKDWQLLLFKKTQKLLDRLLFIFFAEDGGLLPPNSMVKIIEQWENLKDEYDEYQPFYARVRKYFGYMNTGFQGKKYEIFAYNGGLFKPDNVLDGLTITDELLVEHTRKLSEYDFESDVDVNILGHIFENSLSEIEEVTQQINSGQAPQTSKRKQDGVFYTPQYITKYIVENTVGRLCTEKKRELHIDDIGTQVSHLREAAAGETPAYHQRRQMQTKKRLLEQLQQYRDWLLQITILDPACGSGAFLNAALQFLMAEHKLIDEMEAKITGSALEFKGVENSILENNLFGVDINEESVEIAQLALWLRTAKPHRKLNTLNQNIKCGNSLISDPKIAGDKAFDWQKEFPQVFGANGTQVSHLRKNVVAAGETPAYHCRKYLPHIENRPLQFITFRLYDSLPQQTIDSMKAYKDALIAEGKDNSDDYRQLLVMLDKYEDTGYGQCFLKDECVAQIVQNALLHFHGDRYELVEWCIMPNHVHVLINVLPGHSLSSIMHSWRTFTAHEANKALGRSGQFWMREYFDRYIRDEEHLNKTINYIRNNPVKAGLVSDFDSWRWRGDGTQVSHLRNAAGADNTDNADNAASETLAYQKRGFDVVIGNPPYVRADSPGNSLEFRNYMTSCGQWQTLGGKWDLYIPFLELATKLTKPSGLCAFIIPDAYCHAEYGKPSLEYMKSKRYLSLIDYFPDTEVFENVGVKSVIVHLDMRRAYGTQVSHLRQPAEDGTQVSHLRQPAEDGTQVSHLREAAGETPAYQPFVQRIHDANHNYVDRILPDYPANLRIDAKQSVLQGKVGLVPLTNVCYLSVGIVGNSDEKKYKGEFDVSDLLSETQDDCHPKLYYEGKDVGKWLLTRHRYIEYGTERSPMKWRRKGFTELFEGGPKLVTMRSPGTVPRTLLDTEGGYFNESAIGMKRWCDLQGVQNNSLSKAYDNDEERAGFEQLSRHYSYPALLAILNSTLIRYELNTNRRSNIHIYPDDWKRIMLPAVVGTQVSHLRQPAENGTQVSHLRDIIEEVQETHGELTCEEPQVGHLRTLADTMLTLNAQLQERRNRFLRRLKENFEGVKITTTLQTFDELSFATFVAELKKQKIKLSPMEQDQWEEYFDHYTAACRELTAQIASTDREIGLRVYRLYGLTYESEF